MNNTEKKLDALIDALGFDVEEVNEQSIPTGQIIVAHDYKLTKRDEPADDEPQENANRPPIGLTPQYIHDASREEEIISAIIRYLKTGKPIPPDWTAELRRLQVAGLFEASKNVPCTVPTTIVSSTILKRELLKILETAGRKPKKETIAIIEHAIDKAFNL
jgi:hypothetical protein